MEKTEQHKKYLEKLDKPSLDRTNSKHYIELQYIAYHLVRYLRMNDSKDEHCCQGNWNATYLIENMTKKDFIFVLTILMRRVPLGELRTVIQENFADTSVGMLNLDHSKEDVKCNKPKRTKFQTFFTGLGFLGLGNLLYQLVSYLLSM